MSASSDQLTLLGHYQAAMAELGFETRLSVELAEGPGPLLTVGIPRDAAGRDRQLHIVFLPVAPEDELDNLTLLQWFTPLPLVLHPERIESVEGLLACINRRTALGYFGLSEQGRPFHRHVHATPKWSLPDPRSLQQMALVFVHMQDLFEPLIEAVAAGELTLAQAEEILP
jgi:hypothetical protein